MNSNNLDIGGIGPSVDLNIAIGNQLLMEVDEVNYTVNSLFIGYKKDEYFLTTLPSKFGTIKQKLFPGNHVVIKYLHQGTVYVFPTKIMDIISKPTPLIVFIYPKFIQSVVLRAMKRAESCIPTQTTINKTNRGGIIRDITINGCCCHFRTVPGKPRQFQLDRPIKLECQFPGIEGGLELEGAIKNIQKKEGQNVLGIKFNQISSYSEKIIIEYLYSIGEVG